MAGATHVSVFLYTDFGVTKRLMPKNRETHTDITNSKRLPGLWLADPIIKNEIGELIAKIKKSTTKSILLRL